MFQDPLMRRIEGSQVLPPGAVIPHRRLGASVQDFNFQAKKMNICLRALFGDNEYMLNAIPKSLLSFISLFLLLRKDQFKTCIGANGGSH